MDYIWEGDQQVGSESRQVPAQSAAGMRSGDLDPLMFNFSETERAWNRGLDVGREARRRVPVGGRAR